MAVQKEKIMKRLQEHLDYVIDLGYNEDRILGIFLYGSQNYGFATETSDVDSKVFILPSFSDLCLNTSLLSKEIHYKNGEHIDLKDFRSLRIQLMKQNINYTEILFTEYCIINPKYKDLFHKYFIASRESIARYDELRAIQSISGQLVHTLKQNPTDNKKLHNAKRLFYFLEQYVQNKPYLECIQPKEENFTMLWNLKYGLLKVCSNPEKKLYLAETLMYDVDRFATRYRNRKSPERENAEAALDIGTIEILRSSFDGVKKEFISKKNFFRQLTPAEERAYYSIIEEIGGEGSISIVKLVEKNKISRSVYNNLLSKMKENKVADITSMGMKGTYIKITHPELKAEAFEF